MTTRTNQTYFWALLASLTPIETLDVTALKADPASYAQHVIYRSSNNTSSSFHYVSNKLNLLRTLTMM